MKTKIDKDINNKYVSTMLRIIKKNLDYLIEVAEDYDYEDTFIERLKEMKDDVGYVREAIDE